MADNFDVFLNSISQYFVENLCRYVHQEYHSILLVLCCVIFWYCNLDDVDHMSGVWKSSFLFNCLDGLKKNWNQFGKIQQGSHPATVFILLILSSVLIQLHFNVFVPQFWYV